jgi:hypothetical protein
MLRGAVKVDVADVPGMVSSVDDDRAGANPLSPDKSRPSHGGDDDVSAAHQFPEVDGM